jgi:hypothetical protein
MGHCTIKICTVSEKNGLIVTSSPKISGGEEARRREKCHKTSLFHITLDDDWTALGRQQ